MTFPDNLLPARPLALKQSSLTLPRGYAFAWPIVLLLTGFLIYWQAPDLWRDYQISQNPLLMENGQVLDGECKTRKGVFTDCKARISYVYQGKSYQGESHIFFVDAHSGDYETDIVISADHPEMATLSLGLEKFWNRVISFGALAGLMVLICLISVVLGVRTSWARSHLPDPAPLKLVPVQVTTFKQSGRSLFVTYADKIADDRTKRVAYSKFGKGQEPIIIGENGGHAVALAVRHGKTAYPVLLDAGLERVRMTDEERAASLAALQAHRAAEPPLPSLREKARKGGVLRGLLIVLAILVVMAAAVLGYWLWYVTSAPTQYVQVGMEINNVLPKPLNEWGCDQLQKRFGDQNAPFGCVAADFKSWK